MINFDLKKWTTDDLQTLYYEAVRELCRRYTRDGYTKNPYPGNDFEANYLLVRVKEAPGSTNDIGNTRRALHVSSEVFKSHLADVPVFENRDPMWNDVRELFNRIMRFREDCYNANMRYGGRPSWGQYK